MLVKSIYKKLKKTTPTVSETELTALKAGTSSIETHVYSGNLNWDALKNIKTPTLTEEEQSFLEYEVQTLCEMVNDHQINNDADDLAPEVWEFIRTKGFFGLQISKDYGGKEFSPFAISKIVSTIASKSVVAAVTVMVPNSLGPAELLQHYGTDQQKSAYLPNLANGKEIPCFALTSPEAGSDATSIPDEGIVVKEDVDGVETLGFRLSWDKRYITLAPVATLIGLAFKAKDPDGLIGDTVNLGITCALIPSDLPGVFNNKRHQPCGLKFMNGPTTGQSVFIPLSSVIGGKEYIGHGWRMLVEQLSCGRGVSLPALGASSAAVSYKTSLQYARLRKQFGTEIYNFEGILEPLSKIATNNLICESFRTLVLTALNKGDSPSILTAMAKYHITELSRESINHAMDIHAGKAIQCGTDNYLNYLYRGSPVAITVEGANILTRSLMIFGQGSVRCHPYLLKEFSALKNPDDHQGYIAFKGIFKKHLKYAVSNYIRAKRLSLFGSNYLKDHYLSAEVNELSRLMAGYAFVSELLLLSTGGDVKRKEHLSARLGDILSYLTIATSVLVHFENNEERENYPELYTLSLIDLLNKINTAAEQLEINCTSKLVACWIRKFLKPKKSILSTSTDNRKKCMLDKLNGNEPALTHLVHMDSNGEDGISVVHKAYANKHLATPIYLKIKQAIKEGVLPSEAAMSLNIKLATEKGIISDSEELLIKDAEKLLRKVISVQSIPK